MSAAGGVNPRTARLTSCHDCPRVVLRYRWLSAGPPGTSSAEPLHARLAAEPGSDTSLSVPFTAFTNPSEYWLRLPADASLAGPTTQRFASGDKAMKAPVVWV